MTIRTITRATTSLRRVAGASLLFVFALPAAQQAAAAEQWTLAGVEKFLLHDGSGQLTGLYRTQGIATDGNQFFFSWQYGLERTDSAFNSLQRNSSLVLPASLTPGIPSSLLSQGLNHIGDIDYYNGIIYASLDTTSGYTNGHVALYNASDLSYTGVSYELVGSPSNLHKDVASWVAVDGAKGLGYGKEWQDGNTINVYDLDDWSFERTITLDRNLKNIQGAKVFGDWLYMSSDNSTQSIYRANLTTGAVEELFQLPTPDGDREVEGIALRTGADGSVDLYVEMIVDPDRSDQDLGNANLYSALYHYTLAPAVPEPQSLAMLLAGAGLVAGAVRRRKRG